MEYKCQRLYRDARIFSIYEGTTQLQVVAAIRYITNGTYMGMIKDMLEREVADSMKALKVRVALMAEKLEDAVNAVKEAGSQELQDFVARRLYEMTADTIMSLLILDDATRSPQLFEKSANVYVRYAEAEVNAQHSFIKSLRAEDLEYYRQAEKEAETEE